MSTHGSFNDQIPLNNVNNDIEQSITQIAALLSDLVYYPQATTPLPNGVRPVCLTTILLDRGVSTDQEHWEPHSRLFSWETPDQTIYFFVNRGTDSEDDWAHNLLQLGGLSAHFMETALVAYEVFHYTKERSIELIFCGHSKGGTHAGLHGFLTSCRAITFNSPGVSPLTKTSVAKKLKLDENLLNHNNTTSYVTDLDLVTTLSKYCHESRFAAVERAKGIHPQFEIDPERIGFAPPAGHQVSLIGSANPLAEVLLRSFLHGLESESFQAGVDKFVTQLHERHSMIFVLKCMNLPPAHQEYD